MVPEIVDMVLPVEGVFHNLVIVKIKKDYPGQALKVMNSLWGAGQMMFTKMMVVVDGNVNIHNNMETARYISENCDPATDLIFTQGPADVLDHSCSKMAYGGKLGIDATKKLPEEIQNEYESATDLISSLNKDKIQSLLPEIHSINDSLLSANISLVFVAVKKSRKGHIRELNEQLFRLEDFRKVKVVIFLDHTLEINDIADAVWRFSNNIDPRRDHFIIPAEFPDEYAHVGFDGTRKTKIHDGFERDWPNILASDEQTIHKVDEMWDKLGLGMFLKSPSLKYRKQLYKGGAVVEE
jgi:4-hydroxy-3-polyprenylbenzoate decarboxylase